jgi:multidrug efflux system membrane fusion protein
VQASALVTVKPMVDGKLVEVLFKEGQDVEAGDVLARIDPRSFQATLDQAVAKKRQDEANLANARIDLARYQTTPRSGRRFPGGWASGWWMRGISCTPRTRPGWWSSPR